MPRMPSNFLEIGKTGLNWSAGYIYDEFLSTLRYKEGIKTYREMRDNDPVVGACVHAITQILRESRWGAKVPEGGSEEDRVFLEDNMKGMTHTWMEFVTDALSMVTYGWSWFEQVYMRRKTDNRIMWKKFGTRKQSSYEKWEIDNVGETLGLWQRPPPSYRAVYIPIQKSLHFRTDPNGGNPEGRSVLRSAFKPWYYKKHIEEIEGIGLERDLTGMPHITLPENVNPNSDDPEVTAMITAAKRLVSSVRRDEQDGIITPFGWEFELISSPGQRQFDTTQVINRYNKEIAVTVLAQFIMLGMERTGSYALAREQTDMFYLSLESWLDGIASIINRNAVSTLFKLNGKVNRPLPYVVHTPVRRFDLKEISEYVAKMAPLNAIELDEDLKTFLKSYARLSEFSDARL